MNLLITQNSQNLQHSHSFSGSHTHNHKLLIWTGSAAGIANTYPGTLVCSNRGKNDPYGYSDKPYYQGTFTDPYIQHSTVTISGYTGNSGSSTEARPVDYTYKIWKRTA